jgi:hypothetical protein
MPEEFAYQFPSMALEAVAVRGVQGAESAAGLARKPCSKAEWFGRMSDIEFLSPHLRRGILNSAHRNRTCRSNI